MTESKESSGVAHNGIDGGSISNNQTTVGRRGASVNVERGVAPPQDQFLPIANVNRIMKKALPANAKISKEARETIQECVSEFVSYITGEASDKCQHEKRKTINGDDLLWSMNRLDFMEYVPPLKIYLQKYRESEGEKSNNSSSQQQQQQQTQQQPTQNKRVRVDPNSASSSGVGLGVGNYSDYVGRNYCDYGNSMVDSIAAQYTYPIGEGSCSISNLGNETQYGKVEPSQYSGFDPNIFHGNTERENCKGKRVLTNLEGLDSGEIFYNKRMRVYHNGASSGGADLEVVNYSNYGNVVPSRRNYSDYGIGSNGIAESTASLYTSLVGEGGSSISNLGNRTQCGKAESSHYDGFDPHIFHRNAKSENGRGKRALTNVECLDSGEILHNFPSQQLQPTHNKGMFVDHNGASSSGAGLGAINYSNYGNVVPSRRNYSDYENDYNGKVDFTASQYTSPVGEGGSFISNLGNGTQNDKAESSHYGGFDPSI